MKRWPSEASVKFFDETFLQKSFDLDLALDLMGVSQREARETAQRFSRPVAQLPSQSRLPPCQRLGYRLGRPLGNVPPGRSGPEGGAKYVRCQKFAQSQLSPPPLGEVSCLWHDGEGNPLAPRTHPCPPPSLMPKGGTRLGRGDRGARCGNLCRPWRHGGPPARVLHLKMSHRDIFSLSCACWRYKTVGRCPTPCQLSFVESWAKNFTRLRRARELIVRTGVSVAHRPRARIVPCGHAPRIAWGATPAHARWPLPF